jgi:HlyD family secretion protein
VARGRVEETVTNSKAGTIKTRRRSSLSPEVGGLIAEIGAREGDRVVAGQVLVRLVDDQLRAQARVAERAITTASAAEREACLGAEQASRDLLRAVGLHAQDIVSEDRLEQARLRKDASAAACDAARATVQQARASLDLAQATLEKSVIRAPFDGVVAELRGEVGEFVAPSTPGVMIPSIIDLIDLASLYVNAPLDEVDIGRITVGLPVRVTIDAYADRAFTGSVARIAPYVQDVREQSRTFDIEVEMAAIGEGVNLLPGTTADVEVILSATDDVLRIPSYALLEGNRVLVVRDGKLVGLPVQTGLRNWEHVEITSGLAAGDRVVTSLDRAEVVEGARVTITEEAGAAQADAIR